MAVLGDDRRYRLKVNDPTSLKHSLDLMILTCVVCDHLWNAIGDVELRMFVIAAV